MIARKSISTPAGTPSSSSIKAKYKVAIEACKSWQVFRRRATEFYTELCALLPVATTVELSINGGVTAPRRGAFEVEIIRAEASEPSKSTLIWSGLKKGPPRKEKFPDAKLLIDSVLEVINN